MPLEMSTLVNLGKKLLLILGFLLFPLHSLFASDAEIEKLQWHLNRVEGILRQVDTSLLTDEQKVNRTKMLDRLHLYTEAGKFPNNDKFPGESVPFFRGSNGNLCAVGYLMDADPEYEPFIETIVQTNNNVRIMNVQDNPILNTWAKKYGFSILELAMIQPTYSFWKDCNFEMVYNCSLSEAFDLIHNKWDYLNTSDKDKLRILWRIADLLHTFVGIISLMVLTLPVALFFHWKHNGNLVGSRKALMTAIAFLGISLLLYFSPYLLLLFL